MRGEAPWIRSSTEAKDSYALNRANPGRGAIPRVTMRFARAASGDRETPLGEFKEIVTARPRVLVLQHEGG
jgi:hypothetical protein